MFKSIASKLFGNGNTKFAAKNRLQMILVQDRSGLSPQDMDLFKRDMLDVISKYFLLERAELDVEWDRSDGSTALVINTPVVGRSKESRKQAAVI